MLLNKKGFQLNLVLIKSISIWLTEGFRACMVKLLHSSTLAITLIGDSCSERGENDVEKAVETLIRESDLILLKRHNILSSPK